MSRELGRSLPALISQQICSTSPDLNAVCLITNDSDGFPHVALVSYFELILLDQKLFLYLPVGSRSTGFLDRRKTCTLVFIQEGSVYYVKAAVLKVGIIASYAMFEIRLAAVLLDSPAPEEAQTHLESGIRFATTAAGRRRRQLLKQKMVSALKLRI